MQPLVSVIINCHNGGNYLHEAINSVINQTYKTWEIIILNNASTDNTKEIIYSYDNQKIKYYENTKKITLGKARNLALKYSNGDYVAILDSDDIWFPDKLEIQIELMINNIDIGFSYTDSYIFNGKSNLFSIFQKSKPKDGLIFGSLLETVQSYISSETLIYDKRKLHESNIEYNEDFTMIVDYDVILRLSLNYKAKYVNKVLSRCRLHPNSESQLHGSLVPKENFIMIEQLLKTYPKINKEYSKELSKFYYINTILMSYYVRKVHGIIKTITYLFNRTQGNSLYKSVKIFLLTEVKYYYNMLRSYKMF